MHHLRTILLFCAVPSLAIAVSNCGSGESSSQAIASFGGDAGDASAGASGQAGSGGSSGTAGAAGASGTAGFSGAAGSAGTAGAAGNAGKGGAAGDAGSAGDSGAAGTSGNSGAAGDSGSAGDAGSAGTAGNSGGAAGNAGDAGAAGNAGDAGAAGNAGDAGAAGNAGDAGAAGNAGDAGAAGSSGASGAAGAGGDAGSSGASGSGGSQAGGAAGAPPDAGTPLPCGTDADCPAGSSCQITPDSTLTQLELRCLPLVGANGNGFPCTGNSQCRTGQCLQGYCSNLCGTSADCTQAGTCYSQDVQVGGLTGTFNLCLVSPCSASKQCEAGEVCSDVLYTATGVDAFCRLKQQSGGSLGASCQSGSECISQLCVWTSKTCSEACAGDLDCAASPGSICVDTFRTATDYVQTCTPGCSKASDCAAPMTCVIAVDTAGDRHRFTCEPPRGPDPTGTDCSTVNHCASGLCLTNIVNGQVTDHICTQTCVVAADCPAGYGDCVDVQMSTPSDNGKQTLRVCNHPVN